MEKVLRELRVDTLVICGIMTDCCVMLSAYEGYIRDFKIVLLQDATDTRTDERKKWAIDWMKRFLIRDFEILKVKKWLGLS